MLAGDVYNGRVWWRLQVFKLIYSALSLKMWRRALADLVPGAATCRKAFRRRYGS